MAAIHDLLAQVQDKALRARLEQEINRLSKTKKFGLVFEEHMPECTPLYDVPVKKGSIVAKKAGAVSEMYEVNNIKDGIATCYHKVTAEKEEIALKDLVCVAAFGDSVYPYLKPIDSVCNAPDRDLWHTLIEADNYHALQLLEYLYAGKVDCIYIDPPYNTGAKDWKYNNDYVDGNDVYRHSKWLSMIQKRLNIAKRLLNMDDSVLIVTIDEKEYLHLGCLLEEMFPEANFQMLSVVISQNGSTRQNEFSRVNEYIFVLRFGKMNVKRTNDNMLSEAGKGVISRTWYTFSRTQSPRKTTHKQFYPIFIDPIKKEIVSIGDSMELSADKNDVNAPEGQIAVFPIKNNGEEVTWGAIPETAREFWKLGYLRVGEYDKKNNWWTIQYVRGGDRKRIEDGQIIIKGRREDGSLILEHLDATQRLAFPKTVWNRVAHDATVYGTGINSLLMPDRKFPFPKSLYAVEDTLRFFVSDKPDALILDFFAGSGTTCHAVMRLNHQDGGNRRCILVTNNAVSLEESKELISKGCKPGDPEWEKQGICRFNTFPRLKAAITGVSTVNTPVKGNYKFIDEFPMEEGFSENLAYFKLGFLDKNAVALGRQLADLIPVLWLKAGAIGKCPNIGTNEHMLVIPENKFAILIDDKYYQEFVNEIDKNPEISTLYFITDSDAGYREMISRYPDKFTYQLYRDYLDNFRINVGR